ncbi:peptidase inhibitor family I36 protein [Cellulosimicrobium cellulans]|uniref:peptidase inhibitor family I36 protein n=1 Tax=Cellulosimicrobium cellulans TaxID=1710 RepID=UPI0036E93743
MKSRIAAAAIAGVLALGASIAGATGATAATSDCPSGHSCQWKDAGYVTAGVGTAFFSFFQCEANFALRSYGGYNGNDSVSSISNKGNFDSATYYYSAAYSGVAFTLTPGSGDSNLADGAGNRQGVNFSDTLSSGKFSSFSDSCR